MVAGRLSRSVGIGAVEHADDSDTVVVLVDAVDHSVGARRALWRSCRGGRSGYLTPARQHVDVAISGPDVDPSPGLVLLGGLEDLGTRAGEFEPGGVDVVDPMGGTTPTVTARKRSW